MSYVLITGGSEGIGYATAALLSKKGHAVAILGRDAEKLALAKDNLMAGNPNHEVLTIQQDMGAIEQLETVAHQIQSSWGQLDVLINNAGLFLPAQLLESSIADIRSMMEVNVFGVMALTRACLPLLRQSNAAYIFNVGSTASRGVFPDRAAYAITKQALLSYSQHLRQALKPEGIGVSSVLPGSTFTASWAGSGVDPNLLVDPEAIAAFIHFALEQKGKGIAEEIIITPQNFD